MAWCEEAWYGIERRGVAIRRRAHNLHVTCLLPIRLLLSTRHLHGHRAVDRSRICCCHSPLATLLSTRCPARVTDTCLVCFSIQVRLAPAARAVEALLGALEFTEQRPLQEASLELTAAVDQAYAASLDAATVGPADTLLHTLLHRMQQRAVALTSLDGATASAERAIALRDVKEAHRLGPKLIAGMEAGRRAKLHEAPLIIAGEVHERIDTIASLLEVHSTAAAALDQFQQQRVGRSMVALRDAGEALSDAVEEVRVAER